MTLLQYARVAGVCVDTLIDERWTYPRNADKTETQRLESPSSWRFIIIFRQIISEMDIDYARNVLAAGYGTRLWPLTVDRTKPAIPFMGRPLVVTSRSI